MTAPNGEPESYLLAYRDVWPLESADQAPTDDHVSELEKFLEQAVDLSQEHQIRQASLFPIQSLRVVLFERRARAEDDDETTRLELLHKRLFAKYVEVQRPKSNRPGGPRQLVRRRIENPIPITLQEAERIHTQKDGPPVTRATEIVVSSSPRHSGRPELTELSLLIDSDSAVATSLMSQHQTLEDNANNMVARRRLPRGNYPAQRAREISFMTARFAGERERKEFIEALSAELPVTNLAIGPLTPRLEGQPLTD